MKNLSLYGVVAMLAVSSSGHADGGYVGLGVGQSEINQGLFGEYGDGFKVFGGYRAHPNFAVEAAYMNFGEPSEDLFGIQKEYEACAAAVWAKGLWPATRNIELFGKVGWAYWEAESYTSVFGSPTVKKSWEGNDFTWGVGVAFNQWDKFSIQLEYEDVNADLDTITLWSISGLYRF